MIRFSLELTINVRRVDTEIILEKHNFNSFYIKRIFQFTQKKVNSFFNDFNIT